MFVLGVGIGGVMQVLVIAVQNAVAYEDLGAATSGATFFRSMRGSFGTAVFGAIFANLLTGNLKHYLAGAKLPSSLTGASVSPAALAKLPAAAHGGYVQAYAHSLQTVFLVAVPIAAVAFALTWLLHELKLLETAKAVDPGAFVMPTDRSSVQEMERALTVLARRENRGEALGRLAARAGLEIEPAVCWLLLRIARHPDYDVSQLTREPAIDCDRIQHLINGMRQTLTTGIQPLRANLGDRHSFAADPALVMDDWFLSVSRRRQQSSPMPAPAPKQGAESRHWLALQFATSRAAPAPTLRPALQRTRVRLVAALAFTSLPPPVLGRRRPRYPERRWPDVLIIRCRPIRLSSARWR
jgi:hypothetical protein